MREETQMKIAVLGSTGSVGVQAIDVAEKQGIRVSAISANRNVSLAEAQARRLRVEAVAMADETAARELRLRLSDTSTKVYSGESGISEMIRSGSNDVILNGIIGKAGLIPTLSAIETGARLALANKESLVIAGEIVTRFAKEKGSELIPVDSEHSAIFQCLMAGEPKEVKRILLTASGGPFFGLKTDALRTMGVGEVLAHPTWRMGAKITVDSATLMNKGFEVIEAVHLFGVPADRVGVLIHRESIIHSMVEYIDNSVVAQMSVPDMRLCAQYAITYPHRAEAVIPPLDLSSIGKLSFAEPDYETFSLLRTAMESIRLGGALPAVLNAANEVAVAAFLAEKIPFYAITESVNEVVSEMMDASRVHDLDGILLCDQEARARTERKLKL